MGDVAETSFTRSLHTRVKEACRATSPGLLQPLQRCVASVTFYQKLPVGRVVQSLVYARFMLLHLYHGEANLSGNIENGFLAGLSSTPDAQTLCPVFRLLEHMEKAMSVGVAKGAESVHCVNSDNEQQVIREMALANIKTAERFVCDLKRGEGVLRVQPVVETNIQTVLQEVWRFDDDGSSEVDLLFEADLSAGCEGRDGSAFTRCIDNLNAIQFDEQHIRYWAFSIWAVIAFYVFGWVLPSVTEALGEMNTQLDTLKTTYEAIPSSVKLSADHRLNTGGLAQLTLFTSSVAGCNRERSKVDQQTQVRSQAAVIYRAVFSPSA